MRTRARRGTVLLAAAAVAAAAAGCTSAASTNDNAGSGAPGKDSAAVGFIFVGPKDDFGYNQAAFEGSQAVAEKFPDLDVITAENVPEDDNAARVMTGMIQKGAKIIFATSYGHLDAALKVAEENPDVVVVQQGNVINADAIPPNAGTYFGTVYEPVYLAGVAAGLTTHTDKLGYVYAFPIPQTIANIDAFQLGAASVNPDVQTFTVNTSSWCDPAKQALATQSLLSQGVDVITQHQDCTATVIKTTEAAGAYTVGYHADASSLAPHGWLTGSEWNWGPLYEEIVTTALAGDFTGSKFNANYRVGLKNGTNPFVQSEFGPAVTPETEAAVAKAAEFISSDEGSPFRGPVKDQTGKVRIPDGEVPDYATLDGIDYFVQGVVGELPSS